MDSLVFFVPFHVDLDGKWKEQLQRLEKTLDLTPTRVDDWDSQVAFGLVGETGAIRLFSRNDEEAFPFALLGTAGTSEDRAELSRLYGHCLDAAREVAQIDYENLITPEKSQQVSRQGEWSRHEVREQFNEES